MVSVSQTRTDRDDRGDTDMCSSATNIKDGMDGYCYWDVEIEKEENKFYIQQLRRNQYKKGSNTIFNGSIF